MSTRKGAAPVAYPPETRDSMLKAIGEASEPLSAKTLGALPGLARKVPATRVPDVLADDLKSGAVFVWGAKTKAAFWHLDPKSAARDRLLEISATKVLTRSELDKHAAGLQPELGPALVRTVRDDLIKDRLLREVPAAGSGARRVINAERPESYLEIEIARLLESFGMSRPPERIRELLAAKLPGPTPVDEDAIISEAAEKIFSAMNRIAAAPGTTVTFYRLRQQPELTNIPKKIFDRAALLLQEERKALLGIHDHAAGLPAEERERFVTDGLGKFYVSIYAR